VPVDTLSHSSCGYVVSPALAILRSAVRAHGAVKFMVLADDLVREALTTEARGSSF
jgi:hypothetical protein